MADVVVAGSGPAGWAAAGACTRAGLEVALVAPDPHTPWRATYGMWADETGSLPAGSRWVEAPATAFALSEHKLERNYAVLDNISVQDALSHPDILVIPDRIAGSSGRTVTLASGRVLSATLVIDATGTRTAGAAQTAYGVIMAGAPARVTFMDWRPPPGFDSSTFRYSVPLPGDRVLVEETSLARRPGLGMAELRARLAARGITGDGTVERVRIPVGLPVPRMAQPGVVPFGAAGALVHPATGYSVADTFRLAPRLAEAISATLRHRPDRAAWQVLWPPAARAVHLLRRRGLAVLLGLPPRQVPEFFELFLGLPAPLQRAYLSRREDLSGTVAAMAEIFRSADRTMRTTIGRFVLFPHRLGPIA